MKTISVYIFIILIVGIAGCDLLNYDENTPYTKKEIFNDPAKTKSLVNHLYSYLPHANNGFNKVGGAMLASATDDASEINPLSSVHDFNDGSWSSANLLDNQWGHYYHGIADANNFLANFDFSNFDERKYNEDYEQLKAHAELWPYETRFLRAYFYFNLIKRYDHVPLVTKNLTEKEANNIEPSSYQKVTDFIVAECDTVIKHLPADYKNEPGQETGRATRGAAMALKARALLYAASPLHNSSGDTDKWKKAAKAAKAIIDSSWYSLESNYNDVFNNLDSEELIFERRQANESNNFERDNFPIGFEGTNDNGTAPTQNLVGAYEMQNTGLSIDDPSSGYDPDHPYEGRDPRLKETIIVNSSSYKGRKIEIWENGEDGPPQTGATTTGYYLKKQLIASISLEAGNVTTSLHTVNLFRYGTVLLDYAEAMNEAYGPDDTGNMNMTARQAVNKVRERSDMPDFSSGMGKEAFRKKLHNERRVETAFEDHRFWDIRRWEIGPSTTNIKGVDVIKNGSNNFKYESKQVDEREWDERMYFYPIPKTEIFKNEALEQNKGW